METIYVAQARCGLLKVGRTRNPAKRLQGLRKEFRRKGAELARFEPCAPTTNGYAAESRLLSLFGERLARHSGREWFYGGLFENAVRAAHEISDHVRETCPEIRHMTREERAAHAAKCAAYWAPIHAAKAAARLAHKTEWLARTEKRRAIRQFRATVCARIAAALFTTTPAPAAEAAAAQS